MISAQSLEDQVNEAVKSLLDARIVNFGKLRFREESRRYFDSGVFMMARMLHHLQQENQFVDKVSAQYLSIVGFQISKEMHHAVDERIRTYFASMELHSRIIVDNIHKKHRETELSQRIDTELLRYKADAAADLLIDCRNQIPSKSYHKNGYKRLYDHGINSFLESTMPHTEDKKFLASITEIYNEKTGYQKSPKP